MATGDFRERKVARNWGESSSGVTGGGGGGGFGGGGGVLGCVYQLQSSPWLLLLGRWWCVS